MRIKDELKFSDVWVSGKVPPIDEDKFDAWTHKVCNELRHKVLRDGMGLPHLRVNDDLEPIAEVIGGVKLAGNVSVFARVPRADWHYICDDIVNLFDDICAFDVRVDVDHDYYLDE